MIALMEPSVLEYAAPSTPPPASRLNTVTATTLCVFATVPVLLVVATKWLGKLGSNGFRLADGVGLALVIPAFLITIGLWPAIFVLNFASFSNGPCLTAMLTRRSAHYLLAMLAAYLCLARYWDDPPTETLSAVYGASHVVILVWLVVTLLRARLIGFGILVALLLAMTFSVRHWSCPHGERWSFFQLPLYVTGSPCGNDTRTAPYWWAPE